MPLSTVGEFATKIVPKAAPPMISNSAGCSKTMMFPFSIR